MVLASGFTSPRGASRQLIERWQRGDYVLVVSEHILDEVARTLGQDRYFAARTTPRMVANAVELLRREAIVTALSRPVVGVATQPKDDLVLSTALSGNASILCTRDKQLLKLQTYKTIGVLSPGEFLSRLEGETVS